MKRLIVFGGVVFAYCASFAGLIHAGDATITLDDNAGSSSFVVQDSDKTTQFKANSDGQGYFAGNVGIGITNPGNKLHVYKDSPSQIRVNGGINYGAGVEFYTDINQSSRRNWQIGTDGFIPGSFEISSSTAMGGSPLGVLRFIIDSAGNVGIGSTSPGSKLTVAGTIETTSGGVKFPDGTTQTTAASGSATIADASVTQTKLKTATGEVSTTTFINATLPGGEYGFYPQIKRASGSNMWATIAGWHSTIYFNVTTYTTNISIGGDSGGGFYAQQRYVTASGKDHWLFLLIDKDTKDIASAYSAPDHPSYGNGGDPDKVPHPFGSYDPDKHEIIIVDNSTIKQLKQEANNTGKSLLTLVNEEYKINKAKTEAYKPLHSGKFLTQDGQQVMQMIEKLPEYIKVRKLEKLSAGEKSEREAQRQAEQEEYGNTQQKKEKNRAKALNKLKALGLTEDEIKALF